MSYDFSTIKDPMVRDYLSKKYGTNKVADAEQDVENAQLIGVGAGAIDNLANAMNPGAIMQNRMQDLGKTPDVVEGKQQKTDVSGLQKQAQMKLERAESDEDNAVKLAFEQRKQELANELAAKKAEEEAKRWQTEIGLKQNVAAEAARHNMALESAEKAKTGKANGAQNVDLAIKIGENYSKDKVVSDAVQTKKRADEVKQLAANGNGPSDEALIVAFQKALDPGSSVMTGEFSRTEEGQAALQRAQMYLQRVQNGQRLAPEMKQDIVKVVNQLAANADRYHQAVKSRYAKQAEAAGIDPSMVFPNDVSSEGYTTPQQTAKPRTVIQNGHTYTLNPATGEYE